MNRCLLSWTLATAMSFAVQVAAQQQGSGSAAGAQNASQTAPAAQSNSTDIPTPDDQPAAQQAPAASDRQDAGADPQRSEKSKAQRAKDHLKKQMSSWCVGAPLNHCYETHSAADGDKSKQAQSQLPPPPRSDDNATAPPPQPGESSSKDTKVDLSPPPGDVNEHPDSSPEPDSTGEFHPWDPHRAMKNVEVGDYYYKRGNYRAAISRYQEALQWKPRDAEATYKLADAYDHVGNKDEARKNYQAYLKILPHGPRAEDVNKALARLK